MQINIQNKVVPENAATHDNKTTGYVGTAFTKQQTIEEIKKHMTGQYDLLPEGYQSLADVITAMNEVLSAANGKADTTAANLTADHVFAWQKALSVVAESKIDTKIQSAASTVVKDMTAALTSKANAGADNLTPEQVSQWVTTLGVAAFFQNGENESISSLGEMALENNVLKISFTGENGVLQTKSVDLSGLITKDVKVENASYDAATNVITITDTEGKQFTINLSEFSIVTEVDATGALIATQEGAQKFKISKAGQSGDYNDLENLPNLDLKADLVGGKVPLEQLPPISTDETLESVMNRGNFAPKEIYWVDPKGLRVEVGITSAYNCFFARNFNKSASGQSNVAIGYDVLMGLTTGNGNIGLGGNTLKSFTTGNYNIAIGHSAMTNYISGSGNTAVGGSALNKLTTGNYNTALGNYSLYSLTTGNYNTVLGYNAMNKFEGNRTIAIGNDAGYAVKTGFQNVFLGTSAGGVSSNIVDINVSCSTYLGSNSGVNTEGANNVFIGFAAGWSLNKNIVSNRLVIHSNSSLSGATNDSPGIFTDPAQSSINNGLIIGDFKDRWVKINGIFQIRDVAASTDNTEPQLRLKADGTIVKKNVLGAAFPTTPLEGDIFYNTTDKKHYGYDGTNWNALY